MEAPTQTLCFLPQNHFSSPCQILAELAVLSWPYLMSFPLYFLSLSSHDHVSAYGTEHSWLSSLSVPYCSKPVCSPQSSHSLLQAGLFTAHDQSIVWTIRSSQNWLARAADPSLPPSLSHHHSYLLPQVAEGHDSLIPSCSGCCGSKRNSHLWFMSLSRWHIRFGKQWSWEVFFSLLASRELELIAWN